MPTNQFLKIFMIISLLTQKRTLKKLLKGSGVRTCNHQDVY